MATHNEQANRLNELEMKIVLADDMLDQLSQTIFRQQQQIDALAQEVRSLRQQLPQERNNFGATHLEELPPHY